MSNIIIKKAEPIDPKGPLIDDRENNYCISEKPLLKGALDQSSRPDILTSDIDQNENGKKEGC